MVGISTDDIVRMGCRLIYDSVSDIVNVWWAKVIDSNGLGFSGLTGDLFELIEAIYTPFLGHIVNDCVFTDIALSNFTQGEVYGRFPWETLTVGSGVADPEAPGVGLFCYSPTGLPSVQSRKWFGVLGDTDINAGVIIADAIDDIAEGLANTIDPYEGDNGSSIQMGVLHQVEDGEELSVPVFIPYYDWSISNIPGYQRRRRPTQGS